MGLIDLFVPNQKGPNNFLYRNKGSGSFGLMSELAHHLPRE
jgi:hypothetical protein